MKIDIEKLSEAELVDLNNRVVQRLKFLEQMRAHAKMMEFSIGDRVTFTPANRSTLTGIITKYNRKTVTVITDEGQHWNVSPDLLSKVKATKEKSSRRKVVPLKKK
jgi:hypothetical protein